MNKRQRLKKRDGKFLYAHRMRRKDARYLMERQLQTTCVNNPVKAFTNIIESLDAAFTVATVTGRTKCSEPALANIPRKG